jgi:uncharacterized membrane protein
MMVSWWIIGPVLFLVAAGLGIAGTLIYKRYKPGAARTENGGKSQEEQNENSFWFGLGYSGTAAFAAVLIPLLLWFDC